MGTTNTYGAYAVDASKLNAPAFGSGQNKNVAQIGVVLQVSFHLPSGEVPGGGGRKMNSGSENEYGK
jgi:hypothetical protein